MYLTRLVQNGNGKFTERQTDEVWETCPETIVLNVVGPLYFAAVEELEDQVSKLIDLGIKIFILRMRRTYSMASWGVSTLERLIRRAKQIGVELRLARVSEEILHTLTDCSNMI